MTRAFLLIGLIARAALAMRPASVPAVLVRAGSALTGLVRVVRVRPG
jgi:hypothetical protein